MNKAFWAFWSYLQGPVDALKRVLGAQRGLEGMFNQRDVGFFLRVLNVAELLAHSKEVSRNLTGVHQQHSPADSSHVESEETSEWCTYCVEKLTHTGCFKAVMMFCV